MQRTRPRFSGLFTAVCAAVVFIGCGDDRPLDGGAVGQISAAITAIGSPHDVASVAFGIVADVEPCSATPMASVVVPVTGATADPTQLDPGAGDGHLAVQGMIVLVPGSYIVCATPLTAAGTPSADCAGAQAPAVVMGGATTDVKLVSQCPGGGNGAVRGTIAFNDPPLITGVMVPSVSITTCSPVDLAATASDPEGDTITFTWTVVSGPGTANLTATGGAALLSTPDAGEYQIRVTATDPFGAGTSLTFPVDFADGTPCP